MSALFCHSSEGITMSRLKNTVSLIIGNKLLSFLFIVNLAAPLLLSDYDVRKIISIPVNLLSIFLLGGFLSIFRNIIVENRQELTFNSVGRFGKKFFLQILGIYICLGIITSTLSLHGILDLFKNWPSFASFWTLAYSYFFQITCIFLTSAVIFYYDEPVFDILKFAIRAMSKNVILILIVPLAAVAFFYTPIFFINTSTVLITAFLGALLPLAIHIYNFFYFEELRRADTEIAPQS